MGMAQQLRFQRWLNACNSCPWYGGGTTGDGGTIPQGYVYIYRKGAGVWELASEDRFIGQHGGFLGDSAVALSDDGNTIAFTSDWGRNLKIYSREDSGNWNLESDIGYAQTRIGILGLCPFLAM